ncbi:metal-dependent hydrolase [Arthrobacter antibioticus]|uniref:metal-dependent hydrolase n=1 Tax=Arthrobacter sp. H35-MC1 TaxID=3046203 RepID=UPI0024BA4249|nr:metal-dependent hydrolase [Arthrobacter sp. H35-MC1]
MQGRALMMGAHHAASGAALWLALTTHFEVRLSGLSQLLPAVPEHLSIGMGILDPTPAGVVVGALVTAGAGLVPDADHRNATIAKSLPPLSNIVCRKIGTISGGHRHGTHSILGLAFFISIAALAGMWTIELANFGTIYPGAGLLAVLLASFAAKALKIIPDTMRKFPWVLGIAVGVFVMMFAPQEPYWLPLTMALGVGIHIIGDMLTTGGCNLIWPLRIRPPSALRGVALVNIFWRPGGSFAVPILGNAGSIREWLVLVPVSGYVIWAIAATIFL